MKHKRDNSAKDPAKTTDSEEIEERTSPSVSRYHTKGKTLMILYVSGQKEAALLYNAASVVALNSHSEDDRARARAILARIEKCEQLQDRKDGKSRRGKFNG